MKIKTNKLHVLLMVAFCMLAFNDKGLAVVAALIGWGLLTVFWPVPKR